MIRSAQASNSRQKNETMSKTRCHTCPHSSAAAGYHASVARLAFGGAARKPQCVSCNRDVHGHNDRIFFKRVRLAAVGDEFFHQSRPGRVGAANTIRSSRRGTGAFDVGMMTQHTGDSAKG